MGDVGVLHDTPLIMRTGAWAELSTLAETLGRETISAELELTRRPDLHRQLGLAWSVRRTLRHTSQAPAGAPFRVLRFDFHWTDEGWRLSEVNSDVPGGFIEASGFTRLMAEHVSDALPAGDPATALVEAIATHASTRARVGLIHATSYTDDRQVMEFLARLLRQRGIDSLLLSPTDVHWSGLRATGHDGRGWCELDLAYRFFPAEWLPNLGWRKPWQQFFSASGTPQINPPTALLTQSKRFPLAWDALETPLPFWRRYLPFTCDPRERSGDLDDWVLKPALGRVGNDIDICGVTSSAERMRIQRAARRHPTYWAAQRRFRAVPWATANGPLYPAIGVYVIDGHAAGIYARASRKPFIDSAALDLATLIKDYDSLPIT